jgi:hypothetical protein
MDVRDAIDDVLCAKHLIDGHILKIIAVNVRFAYVLEQMMVSKFVGIFFIKIKEFKKEY